MTQPLSPDDVLFEQDYGPLQALAAKMFDENLKDCEIDKRIITIAILLGVTVAIGARDMAVAEKDFDSVRKIARSYADTVFQAKAQGFPEVN